MTTSPDSSTEEYPTVAGSVPPLREWARTFTIGLFMGTADAVPGVSGGTIALIAGIYERLITAINGFTPRRLVRLLRALAPVDGGVSVREALAAVHELDGWFLVALLGGIATAVFAVTGVVAWANDEAPRLLFGFFFGLIGASAVVLLREIRVRSPDEVGAAVLGFLIAFVVSGSDGILGGGSLPLVFLAGVVAVSAMILPGISGSLFLVILGQYTFMSETLHAFVDELVAVVRGGPSDAFLAHGAVVVTFVLGGLVGLFTVARLVRRALDYNRGATLAFLVALVVGALRAPVVRVGEYGIAWTTGTLFLFGGAAVVGAVVVLVLDWYAVDFDVEAA